MSGYNGMFDLMQQESFRNGMTFGQCRTKRTNTNPYDQLSDEDIHKDSLTLMIQGKVPFEPLTGNTKWSDAQIISAAERVGRDWYRLAALMFPTGTVARKSVNSCMRNLEERLFNAFGLVNRPGGRVFVSKRKSPSRLNQRPVDMR